MLSAYVRLKEVLAKNISTLNAISEANASLKTAPGKWSKKEILGHLIDSASNNHQRFVRLQIDNNITLPKYKQDEWVAVQHWQEKEWGSIITLWKLYNEHIAYIFKRIDESKLSNVMMLGDKEYTLQFLIDDYVDHMENHLKQIFASDISE